MCGMEATCKGFRAETSNIGMAMGFMILLLVVEWVFLCISASCEVLLMETSVDIGEQMLTAQITDRYSAFHTRELLSLDAYSLVPKNNTRSIYHVQVSPDVLGEG